MKCVACIIVLSLYVLSVYAYTYEFPAAPCKWGATVEKSTATSHTKTRYWIYGRYKKVETYNHNGDLVDVELTRPDFVNDAYFSTKGGQCVVNPGEWKSQGYEDVVDLSSKSFGHVLLDEKYNGHKCTIYYNGNSEDPIEDINKEAWYVDNDGLIIGHVKNADDWENRVYENITYHSAAKVVMSDFSFSKKDVYGCFDERVYKSPDAYFAQCSASNARVIVGIIASCLLAALAFVF